jgi:hypothetical protein
MAARQDQGLHIALSIFIFLFVGTFVLWYLYFKSASELQQQLTQAETQLSGERDRATKLQTENQRYRQMMGFDELEDFPNVEKTFGEDMQRFGLTFEEDRRFYRDILEYIYEENDKIAAREVAAKEKYKDLTERLLAVESEKETQVTQFEAQAKKAEGDAAAQRVQFKSDRADLEETRKKLQDDLASQRATLQGSMTSLETKLKEIESRLARSEQAKANLLEERTLSSESFEVADGRISWVNQNGTVWINLGEADSLRRQITFSVFDTDQRDAAKAKKKGSIEVTRILGDHLAEARITQDDARNPILTSDQVYSQVWERGNKLHFALTGIIDLDGDGQSDLQLARDLIELNGGVVDSYIGEEGNVVGNMSVVTRYLVLGEYPEEARKTAVREGWQSMNEEASDFGVEVITLDEFLNQMGYQTSDRAVELSGGSQSSGSETDSSDASSAFRPRSPGGVPLPTPY